MNTQNSIRKERLFEAIAVVLFLISAIKFSVFAIRFLDLHLQDESDYYLFWGIHLSEFGFLSPSMAPFYALWYAFLKIFFESNIALFYFNQAFLMVMLPIAFFTLLKVYRIKTPLALIAAFLILISYFNLDILKHNHLLITVCCLAIMGFRLIKNKTQAVNILAIAALLISFIRPEYILVFFILLMTSIFLVIRGLRNRKISWPSFSGLAILLLLSATLFLSVGVPGLDDQKGRSLLAFNQHFSRNYVQYNNLQRNPYLDNQFFNKIFDHPNSVGEAFLNNPNAVIKHIGYNFLQFPVYFPRGLFYHLNLILQNDFHFLNRMEGVILFVLLVGVLVCWFWKLDHRRKKILDWIRKYQHLLLILLVFLLPSLISCFILFPRTHYLMLPGMMLVFLVTLLINDNLRMNFSGKMSLFCALGIFLITPPSVDLFRDSYATQFQPHLNTVRFLDSIVVKPLDISVMNLSYHLYLSNPDIALSVIPYKPGLVENLPADTTIEAIVLDEELRNTKALMENARYYLFLQNMEDHGFKRIQVPDSEVLFFIREEKFSSISSN